MNRFIKLLRYLWQNEDGFFGIGMGPSGAEYGELGALANAGNFGTGEGEADIGASDKFWQGILSGDPTKISTVLGPEESAINKRGQQAMKTTAEFGNRGGGTNARTQQFGDTTRTSLDTMISDLTGKAASTLGQTGSSLLSSGISADTSAFSAANTVQQQHEAKINDLLKSIAAVGAAPFTGGASLAALSMSKPGGGGGGNWWDNMPDYSNKDSAYNPSYGEDAGDS